MPGEEANIFKAQYLYGRWKQPNRAERECDNGAFRPFLAV